jgi:hypothetical protein
LRKKLFLPVAGPSSGLGVHRHLSRHSIPLLQNGGSEDARRPLVFPPKPRRHYTRLPRSGQRARARRSAVRRSRLRDSCRHHPFESNRDLRGNDPQSDVADRRRQSRLGRQERRAGRACQNARPRAVGRRDLARLAPPSSPSRPDPLLCASSTLAPPLDRRLASLSLGLLPCQFRAEPRRERWSRPLIQAPAKDNEVALETGQRYRKRDHIATAAKRMCPPDRVA